jgi:hypothetical protein
MNMNNTAKTAEFVDSTCTCRSCNHKITSECIKSTCSCCKAADHSMVLDGMEGFMTKGK